MKKFQHSFFTPCMAAIAIAITSAQSHGQDQVLAGQTLGHEVTIESELGAAVGHGPSVIRGDVVVADAAPIVTSDLPPAIISHAPVESYPAESYPVESTSIGSAPIGSGSYVGDMPIEGTVDGGVVSGGTIGGTGQRRNFGQPDLFYNFFTQGYANRTNAQMYLSPLPVPPNVGHTFFTYQPFYPHEMLYWHKDKFHRYYDNGRGMNRTRATYYAPPVRQAASNIYWNYLRLPR